MYKCWFSRQQSGISNSRCSTIPTSKISSRFGRLTKIQNCGESSQGTETLLLHGRKTVRYLTRTKVFTLTCVTDFVQVETLRFTCLTDFNTCDVI